MTIKKTRSEICFDIFNHILLFVFAVICLYPVLYVLFGSFSDPIQLMKHDGAIIWPIGYSLEGYKVVLQNPSIQIGYANTIFYVVVGTTLNIIFSSFGAYVLSSKKFPLKKPMMIMVVITMYFGGGLIPNFLLVNNLGMYNSRLALILPNLILTWNMIVMKTSFSALDDGLKESAQIDGANDFVILFKIILPIVKATISVMVLFYAVGHWNSWFNAMIYLRERKLFPLQLFLRETLIANSFGENFSEAASQDETSRYFIQEIIKYSTIVISTVPILCVYPFIQKHFEKGMMLGSVKG